MTLRLMRLALVPLGVSTTARAAEPPRRGLVAHDFSLPFQHPVMKGEMEGPLPLAKVGGR